MILGLIKEGKTPPDRRAALTPKQCEKLLSKYDDLQIIVEPSDVRIFSDQEYQKSGCKLNSSIGDSDILLGVKEVPVDKLIRGKTYFFFSHTFKEQPYNRSLLKACLDKQITLIDWELLKKDKNRLIGFGYYAGLVGAFETLRGFGRMTKKYYLKSAKELGTLQKIKKELKKVILPSTFKAVITGTGNVARGAEEVLLNTSITKCNSQDYLDSNSKLPNFTVLEPSVYVKRKSDGLFEKSDFYQNPKTYENAFQPYTMVSDIFIPCHFWKEGSPNFFDWTDVSNPKFRISFVGDISCDILGPVATTIRPSTLENPFYSVINGKEVEFGSKGSIGVLAVDNLPSAIPLDATHGFGEMFIEKILPNLFGDDKRKIIHNATQTKLGELTPNYKYLEPFVHGFDLKQTSAEKIELEIKEEIHRVKKEIELISKNPSQPTFLNTIIPIEESDENLQRLTELLFNLNSACTNEKIQNATRIISPLLSEMNNEILTNEVLFKRISFINQNEKNLDHEDIMLLEKYFKNFSRNGALLNAEEKSILKSIDKRLSSASLEFSENVLNDNENWFLEISNEQVLDLPESIVKMLKGAAEQRGLKSYCLTLDAPIYIGFMTYSTNRDLKKKLWKGYNQRACRGDSNDNTKLMTEIAELRQKRASVLGYSNHASFVLEERMAKDPETVYKFLESLKEKALPVAKKEAIELKKYAKESLNFQEVKKWDIPFISEKYKKEKLDYNDEITKPYFALNQVIDWAFSIANKLYGLKFQISKQEGYHRDVQVYNVTDFKGNWVSHLLTDWHPRKGKRNGAWMTSYRKAYQRNSTRVYPIISLVCNFSTSSDGKPALLTFNEVLTLFHEFGHGIHGMLGEGKYATLTGTSVAWDFVELPSQFMENWCFEATELKQWARHYKSGEPMPDSIITNIKKSQKFLEGMATIRQLGLGLLDMAWHNPSNKEILDYKKLEESIFSDLELWSKEPGITISSAFSHIFSGGYSAGYYSYKWSEVLDADAFSRFSNEPDNSEVAQDFKKLLKAGGSIDPSVLFKNFMGREPNINALLTRAGLDE